MARSGLEGTGGLEPGKLGQKPAIGPAGGGALHKCRRHLESALQGLEDQFPEGQPGIDGANLVLPMKRFTAARIT